MVWPAIGICTISELERVVAASAVEVEKAKAQAEAANDRAALAETRYDALVERLRVKAATKPDDGIIHAKNSGDVRRLFEAQVASQQLERDKQQEN